VAERHIRWHIAVTTALAVAVAACGGEPLDPDQGDPNGLAGCTDPVEVVLAVGQSTVVDPAAGNGCIRFPAAGAGGAEYLYVASATNGSETSSGTSTSYSVQGATISAAQSMAALPPAPVTAAVHRHEPQSRRAAFHDLLRQRERTFASQAGALALNRARISALAAVVPPTLGSERSFQVCKSIECTAFETVTATAKHVGPKGAIYLDNTVPPDGYTQAELDSVGYLFDNYLYPIDTVAFGRESDLDSNGVVVVLLTDQVNKLSPDCNTSGSVILGFFYGNDLIPSNPGSNGGEVFYGLVPDPDNAQCSISHEFASNYLAPTFIHEFQHMISFNQHVLLRGGLSEDTWLNEGLSHFAEELGGEQIPDAYCVDQDCRTQFDVGDLQNAYGYLLDPESYFLIEPATSSGTLEERGANWLFVRWLVDQFGGGGSGTAFTRQLVGTQRLGAANVATLTGVPFGTLVPQWQLANYLDDLPGFTPQDGRLHYTSWNFRGTFSQFNSQDPSDFPLAFPLVPDSMTAGTFSRNGTLRAGSAMHLRIVQPANGEPIVVQLTDSLKRAIGGVIAAPRVGVARVR
jgi:hypothetical protein